MSAPLVGSLLGRASARHYVRRPWQLGLALTGIALGVALAVAVDVASGSVRRAFGLSAAAVGGTATHELIAPPPGIPEAV